MSAAETTRLEAQRRLDAAKTSAERNKLGQFATPTILAGDILEYARRLLLPDAPVRFLDPALGTGSFYSALLRTFPPDRIAQAVGFEVDPHYGDLAAELWSGTGLDVRIADFTMAKPPSPGGGSNLLICNPPYVRHHHLTADDKLRLQRMVRSYAGVSLSGLAGLYCYFLCLSHAWMEEGGLAGWLIPSEFMDVNYGREVKRYLLDCVTLIRIHRFDPNSVQFNDALVSSAVMWFRKGAPPVDHSVEFSYGGTLGEPKLCRTVPASVLRRSPKWTRFPMGLDPAEGDGDGLKLSDLFTIKRGLATGANEFFVLNREQVLEHDLPADVLTPILPSPRYLPTEEVQADEDGLPLIDRQLWLIKCNLPVEEVQARYPTLWRYLQRGIEAGIPERYLCGHRSPWYAQEDRPPAPILCTYLGRSDKKSGRPFRFILNHSRATAPNVYLMLYPKGPLATVLTQPSVMRRVWETLNAIPAEALLGEGRVYGGGLHKLEPREMANTPADRIYTIPELGQLLIGEVSGRGSSRTAGVARQALLFGDD